MVQPVPSLMINLKLNHHRSYSKFIPNPAPIRRPRPKNYPAQQTTSQNDAEQPSQSDE
ncbi:10406_t:CDS:1, partial [Cetraspora pellucida]